MHRLLGEESIYPPILYCDEHLLVLTFYPYGSLDDIEDRELLQCLAAKAIDNLFRIAAIEAPNLPNPEERQTQSRTFLADEPRIRLRRLRRALRDDPAARAWADGSSLDGHPIRSLLFDYLTSWITDDSTEYPLSRIAAPSLGLAAHGDFGFNNVLLADPASRDATLAFIDTRGRWYRGIPWWDPIMDIATLLAFHCRIDPALSEYGGAGLGRRVDLEESRLSEGEIMGLCFGSRAFRAWSSRDSHWAARRNLPGGSASWQRQRAIHGGTRASGKASGGARALRPADGKGLAVAPLSASVLHLTSGLALAFCDARIPTPCALWQETGPGQDGGTPGA